MSGGGGFTDPKSWQESLSGRTNTTDTAVNGTQTTSGTQTTGTNTTQIALSQQDQEALQTLVKTLQGNAAGFSKDAAIADSADLQGQAIQTLRDSVLPGITVGQSKSGGYNSTSNEQLTNDAITKAGTDLAALRLQTIAQYAAVSNDSLNSAVSALNVLKGAVTTNSGTSTTDTNQTVVTDQNSKETQNRSGLLGHNGFLGLGGNGA